ncbi:MAG: DUF2238 domain-containing protein [Alphaproteobacteria bacterium]|nr:DUF2238 domain-containing protein [Alphaproteobacteria bacterium]
MKRRALLSERSFLLIIGLVALAVSHVGAADELTWWLETFPIFFALFVLIPTANRFPLTPLAYRLIFLHALVLMVGGHYTYANTPIGFWLQDWLHLARNPYDRIGHIFQGFVPALITREILLRQSPLKPGKLLFFLVLCVCLAFSAFYELIEWWSAVALGQSADSFLGTQGDVWDAQWDMFMALIGSTLSQLLLARWHDGELKQLLSKKKIRV